jgi:uncharacterized protein YqeY
MSNSPLLDTLQSHLVAALKSQNPAIASCIRQVKAKVQEHTNQAQFSGDVDDSVVQQVLASYVKSLTKSIAELTAAGDKGASLVQSYQAEITYLKQFLPSLLDAPATRALVDKALESLGVKDAKQAGRVMGAILKEHKGKVDTQMLKDALTAALGG